MPIFLNTTEVRWVFSGKIPAEIQDWFIDLGNSQLHPPRIDRYMPGVHPRWGIKLREGRLEIKFRRKQHGNLRLSKMVEGCMESWVKCGSQFPFGYPAWIPFQKERQILYYQTNEQGVVLPSTPGVMPAEGGGVELTQVRIGEDDLWWTIGIEVFGPGERRLEVIETIARLIFDGFPSMLPVGNSFSYLFLLSEYK